MLYKLIVPTIEQILKKLSIVVDEVFAVYSDIINRVLVVNKFCPLLRITRSRRQWQGMSQLIKIILQHTLGSEAGSGDNYNSEQLILILRTSVRPPTDFLSLITSLGA